MERLLFDHPEGLTRSEIARRLEVDRSTIGRYLNSTGDLFPFMEDEKGKLYLNKTKYLTHVRLTMFELEALHLSARLFARVMKFPFPHASAALRKLAEAQGRVSPALAARICETADDMELYNQYYEDTQRNYRNLIEDLGRAISEQWIIQVRHFSSRQDCDQTYRLMPITLEPYHQGHSVHLLAWDITREPAHQRVLKIERIKEIDFEKRDPEGYKTIPLKEIRKSLKKAWGIYTSDEEPIKVVLHFSPEVAPRVKETHWHESQSLSFLDYGVLKWEGMIAVPIEMYPWIRGWGKDVEIIEPAWLREKHRKECEEVLERYKEKS